MEFYSVIENRKSITKFKDTELDKNSINRMINAAMRAPSWKNNTSYKFIIVDDDNEKKALSETILNKNDKASQSIKEAPVAVVIVGSPDESGEIEGKDYYLVDGAIAMEHFVLAATAEGYGTCWIGALDENKVKEILNIPDQLRIIAMTPVGEIAERDSHNPKKEIKDYVFYNKWDRSFVDEIKH